MKSFFDLPVGTVCSGVCEQHVEKGQQYGQGKGKTDHLSDKIRRTWISLPLRKKAGTITVLAAFAVSCSILMNLVTAGFGMNGFR